MEADAPPEIAHEPIVGMPTTAAMVLAEIARVLNQELQLPRVPQPEDDLALDLQLDSVGLLTLVVELENAFRVALKEEDAAVVRTVGELAALVVARASEQRQWQ